VIEVGTGKQKVAVKSGDYVVGDLNGVVCVPVQLLAEVLDIMPASVEACARIADDLKNGVSFAEARDRHRGG
jgi:regulator of RNase E activity RraA